MVKSLKNASPGTDVSFPQDGPNNAASLAYTIVGRATGTSDISGMFLIETTTINSILTVRNPAGNSTALTITPLAGGTNLVSAHLVINCINVVFKRLLSFDNVNSKTV